MRSFLRLTVERASACGVTGFCKSLAVLCALWASGYAAVQAQTYQVLTNFNRDSTGGNPRFVTLVQGADGNLWGTTADGGTGCDGCGTIFKVTPSGKLTVVYDLNSTSGNAPAVGLLLGPSGDFYGVTSSGNGTVFDVSATGVLTVLAKFDNRDGSVPAAALTEGADNTFYGTTNLGGSDGLGTVYKITTDGTITLLHSFESTDGAYPYGQLVQGTDGDYYGTTEYGGNLECDTGGCGTVFKISPAGEFTLLHSFSGSDGESPVGGLVQGESGNFYGTTQYGGAYSIGTVFEITSTGAFTSLLSFGGANLGGEPLAQLIQATDGNFYGTTYYGTIFQLTPAGTLTTLAAPSGDEGRNPEGGLVQHTNGTFYGVTYDGGTHNFGVVYSLNMGLGPFVKTLPTSGKVGKTVSILGTNLTGVTSVTFNGTAATFTVESATLIKTTVPAGATAGPVQVLTPSGMLTSDVAFQVIP